METLLEVRKTIKDFFDRYDQFIVPCMKFVLAFFTFVMINRTLPFFETLNSVFILVILSLFCAILPLNTIAVIGIILTLLQCFAASVVVGIAALGFFALAIILLLRFVPSELICVVLTPFAFLLHIPAAIPVALGMLRHRSSVAAGIGGVAVYCFLSGIPAAISQSTARKLTEIETVQLMITSFTQHKELILSSIVFTAVILIVNLIRRMVTKYTYLVAVLSGCAFYLILRTAGGALLGIENNFLPDLVGTLLSAVVCLVIAFFIHCADYKRTQLLQFEDDEYYYYVKAVPKRTPDSLDAYEEEFEDPYEYKQVDDEEEPDAEYLNRVEGLIEGYLEKEEDPNEDEGSNVTEDSNEEAVSNEDEGSNEEDPQAEEVGIMKKEKAPDEEKEYLYDDDNWDPEDSEFDESMLR